MHYVVGDVHNELRKLEYILEQIHPSIDDRIYFLGDLFDRGADRPDPVGIYFKLSVIQAHCVWIRGNHDHWLAEYMKRYFQLPERKRMKLSSYHYNSFDLIKERLTEADMLNMAERIRNLPVQVKLEIEGKRYLLAHAMTSSPHGQLQPDDYYLMGNMEMGAFFQNGIEGYISICGHTPTGQMQWSQNGRYLDDYQSSVWVNGKENVLLLDCGCGLAGGRLAAICLETGERFYSTRE